MNRLRNWKSQGAGLFLHKRQPSQIQSMLLDPSFSITALTQQYLNKPAMPNGGTNQETQPQE